MKSSPSPNVDFAMWVALYLWVSRDVNAAKKLYVSITYKLVHTYSYRLPAGRI